MEEYEKMLTKGWMNEWCKENCEYWEDCEECPNSCGLVLTEEDLI